jgi:hypothetical protein
MDGKHEENDEISARTDVVSAEIQKDNLRNTSVERYRFANLLGYDTRPITKYNRVN